jgi:hypothetical protein
MKKHKTIILLTFWLCINSGGSEVITNRPASHTCKKLSVENAGFTKLSSEQYNALTVEAIDNERDKARYRARLRRFDGRIGNQAGTAQQKYGEEGQSFKISQ